MNLLGMSKHISIRGMQNTRLNHNHPQEVTLSNSKSGPLFSIGDRFQNYRLISLAGCGAYGSVFLAEDLVGKKVALKIISPPGVGKSYERELNGLREFRTRVPAHPHLLQIFHVGEADGFVYYTMELADNLSQEKDVYLSATLKNKLSANGPLALQDLRVLSESLCDAVDALHQIGLLHRDIKPDNIIYVNGCPKLGDIGLVTPWDREMSFAGTVGFFPPEILSGKNTFEKTSDLYAIGKVLYMALTGESVENFPTFPKDIPLNCKYTRRVLLQACASNPQGRYQSAKAFSLAFSTAIDMDMKHENHSSEDRLLSLPMQYDNNIKKTVREILQNEIIVPCENENKEKLLSLRCTMWFVLFPLILSVPLIAYPSASKMALFTGLCLFVWGTSFLLLKNLIQRMQIRKAAKYFDAIFCTNEHEEKQALDLLVESQRAFAIGLNQYITSHTK